MLHKKDLAIALSRLSFLNCGQKLDLFNNLDNLSMLAVLSIEDLRKKSGKNLDKDSWNPDLLLKRVERDLVLMKQYQVDIVTFQDPDFPSLLKEVAQPPFALYFRGDISCLQAPCIGVVGTRHPDTEGLKAAFNFSKELAEKGVTVVSGLALGIDSAAHKGALAAGFSEFGFNAVVDSFSSDVFTNQVFDEKTENAKIGTTAAFLGSGVDVLYPAGNKALAGRILRSGGCILSEYPLETPALAYHFPERNRLISGVSSGVMVIEALEKSGSLITVDFALEQNRDVFVHPVALDYEKLFARESKISSLEFKTNKGSKNKIVRRIDDYVADGAVVTDSVDFVLESGKYIYKNEFIFKGG